MRSIPSIISVAILIAIIAVITNSNVTNVQVPAGYAAYIVEKPILGRTTFQSVITGPSSTGMSWRLFGDLVSVTPYSYSEEFSGTSALIAKDKLAMIGNSHIVWQIRGTEEQIRTYMEKFGGLDEKETPDQTARLAYQNYVQQPYCTLVREEFAAYNGLDIPDHVGDMGKHITAELTERLANTPFQVLNVVIGNAQPPPVVLEQIALKVAKGQEFERKATEQSIADANKRIQEAEGEAEGEKALAIAEKRAEANDKLAKSLTPELLQYNAIEAMRGAERIYVPIGAGGIPLVATIPEAVAKKPQ